MMHTFTASSPYWSSVLNNKSMDCESDSHYLQHGHPLSQLLPRVGFHVTGPVESGLEDDSGTGRRLSTNEATFYTRTCAYRRQGHQVIDQSPAHTKTLLVFLIWPDKKMLKAGIWKTILLHYFQITGSPKGLFSDKSTKGGRLHVRRLERWRIVVFSKQTPRNHSTNMV